MKNVLITGGAGYVGTVLTPRLLAAGYTVTVYDVMYYGCELTRQPRLKIIDADIRDTERFREACRGVDAVIHLACISNDPRGVGRFIYASTSSVYGVSEAPEVTETHPLVPLTLYNRYKGLCEPLLFKHQGPEFACVTIRPATVCGYSPRMRLDLTVNILTNHAVNTGKITVFGGEQLRPNLHILDMCDLYELLLKVDDAKIAGETFNAGYQNHSVMDIAKMVRKVVHEEFPEKGEIEIVTTPTNDIRSYHINSDKIAARLGFRPRRGIEDAVRDLCRAFKDGRLPDSLTDDRYVNVRVLKAKRAA